MQEFLDGEKRNNEEKEKSLGVMERKWLNHMRYMYFPSICYYLCFFQ